MLLDMIYKRASISKDGMCVELNQDVEIAGYRLVSISGGNPISQYGLHDRQG